MWAHNPWVTRHSRAAELARWRESGSHAIVSKWVNADAAGYARIVHDSPMPYRMYVGAANLWEHGEVAASTFELLHRGGLSESSSLLEIGCGALRFGRLALVFLLPGKYACIEPQRDLVNAALRFELGTDILRLKRPRFAFNAAFEPPLQPAGEPTASVDTFDYMVAQSIFTHVAADMLDAALLKLKPRLARSAVLFASLFLSDPPRIHAPSFALNAYNTTGWLWKGTAAPFSYFPLTRLRRRVARLGLEVAVLPWKHANNQTWVAFAAAGTDGKSAAFRARPGLFRYHRKVPE